MKYAVADGEQLWERIVLHGAASAVACDEDGDVVVTGISAFSQYYYTAKYRGSDGSVAWERRYYGRGESGMAQLPELNGFYGDGNPYRLRGAQNLALGPGGTVAVTGFSDGDYGPGRTYEFLTILYQETPGPQSFAAWAASFGLTDPDADPTGDPDGDGVASAMEFVGGGNPVEADPGDSSFLTHVSGGIALTFHRADESETSDVALKIELSTDLITWPQVLVVGAATATSSVGVTIVENGAEPDEIVLFLPTSEASRFARLRVDVTP